MYYGTSNKCHSTFNIKIYWDLFVLNIHPTPNPLTVNTSDPEATPTVSRARPEQKVPVLGHKHSTPISCCSDTIRELHCWAANTVHDLLQIGDLSNESDEIKANLLEPISETLGRI